MTNMFRVKAISLALTPLDLPQIRVIANVVLRQRLGEQMDKVKASAHVVFIHNLGT